MAERNIPFGKPIIGQPERDAVMRVMGQDTLVHGPISKEFEKAFATFTRAPFASSLSSCTAGLHLAYFHKKIGPGDEVIVPAETHVATVHAVEFVGAKPVFVDAEIGTGNIDLDQIEAAITPRTKAISIVHFLGMPVDMKRIMQIANKHNLYVVEDCALAIGAWVDGVHVGLHGDLGCYSFYPIKHLTTAEGGMMITRHESVYKGFNLKKAFGVDRTPSERTVPGVYDVVDLGFNYRMNELESAIGLEQMKRIEGFLVARKRNHDYLQKKFREMDEIRTFESSTDRLQSAHYCQSVLLQGTLANKRPELFNYLKENGVGCSAYYPEAVPHFTYYKNKYGHADSSFPVASKISRTSIALPVGPHVQAEDLDYIVKVLKAGIQKLK